MKKLALFFCVCAGVWALCPSVSQMQEIANGGWSDNWVTCDNKELDYNKHGAEPNGDGKYFGDKWHQQTVVYDGWPNGLNMANPMASLTCVLGVDYQDAVTVSQIKSRIKCTGNTCSLDGLRTHLAYHCPTSIARDLAIKIPTYNGVQPGCLHEDSTSSWFGHQYKPVENKEHYCFEPATAQTNYSFQTSDDGDLIDTYKYINLVKTKVYRIFEYDRTHVKDNTIDIQMTACSRLGKNDVCRPIYDNDKIEVWGNGVYTISNNALVNDKTNQYSDNRGNTVLKIVTSNGAFPFKVVKSLAKESEGSSNWKNIVKPLNSGEYFTQDPGDLAPYVNGQKGAFISIPRLIQQQQDVYVPMNRDLPKMVLKFKTDSCKQDMLYKIQSIDKNLYYEGKQKVHGGSGATTVYMSNNFDAECKNDQYVSSSNWYVNQYFANKSLCSQWWKHNLLSEHVFKPRIFMDNSIITFYVMIKGDKDSPDARDCLHKDIEIKEQKPVFQTLYFDNGTTSLPAKIDLTNGVLSATDGILTRLDGGDIALKMNLNKDPNLRYIAIKKGSTNMQLLKDSGQEFIECKTPACTTIKEKNELADYLLFDVNFYLNSNTPNARNDRDFVLRFNAITSDDKDSINFELKLLYGSNNIEISNTMDIAHDPITLRPSSFNLESSITLPVYTQFTQDQASRLSKSIAFTNGQLAEHASIMDGVNAGRYYLPAGQYVVRIAGQTYRFYDSSNTWYDHTRPTFVDTTGFMGMPLDLSYSIIDKTVERYLEEKGLDASKYCNTKAPSSNSDGTYMDSNGKINCSTPAFVKIKMTGASNTALNKQIRLNYTYNGTAAVLLANTKLFRLRIDALNQMLYNNDDNLPIAYEASSDWRIPIGKNHFVGDIDASNFKLFSCDANQYSECDCRKSGSCSLSDLPDDEIVISKEEQNQAFMLWLDKLCKDSRCSKGDQVDMTIATLTSKPSQKDLLFHNTKESKPKFIRLNENSPASFIKLGAFNGAKYLEPLENHHKVYRINYFPKEKFDEVDLSLKYGSPEVTKSFKMIYPLLTFKDLPTSDSDIEEVGKVIKINSSPAVASLNYFDKNSQLQVLGKCGKSPCVNLSYPGSPDKSPGYVQTYGNLGFENDANLRANLISQYNNAVEFIPASGSTPSAWRFINKHPANTYTKDIINCFGAAFTCGSFSVEYKGN